MVPNSCISYHLLANVFALLGTCLNIEPISGDKLLK